ANCADSSLQEPTVIKLFEGDSVTIKFRYSAQHTSYSLQLYRQYRRKTLTFLIYIHSYGDPFRAEGVATRFLSSLDTSSSEGNFNIGELQLSDSAVYYCGLRDTVTGTRVSLVQKLCRNESKLIKWCMCGEEDGGRRGTIAEKHILSKYYLNQNT
ncbi:hypothetical protein chiPu_0029334, partial [Chiloscyllium punctatum]|nr:hypothetical protein [Chiloscyllium punctatum]